MTTRHPNELANAVPFGRRSPALDGIRGLAILGVLCYHTLRIDGDGGPPVLVWRYFQESSWIGVDLFFVLSGFLITGILLDSKESGAYFRNFYARRALRIMPLYYCTLLAALVVLPLAVGLSKLPALYATLVANQLWLWLYLQNFLQAHGAHQLPGFGHFWTLAVEEQFYWVWPLMVFFAGRRMLMRLCLAICLCEPFVRLILLQTGTSGWTLRELTFTRADSLLWGALGAIVVRDSILLAKVRWPMIVAGAASVLALMALSLQRGFLLYEAPETVTAGYSLLGCVFGVFVVFCALSHGLAARAISAPALRWFGKYSYAIYIAHPILRLAYDAKVSPRLHLGRFPAAIACFAIVTAASAAFAWLSWELIESRFLRLKKYFEYRDEPNETEVRGICAAPAEEASVSS